MTPPGFIDGRQNAVVLAALQIGTVFMAVDWLAVKTPGGGDAVAVLFPMTTTVLLALNLAARASVRGHSRRWGYAAGLSLVGVVVVYCLRDRVDRYGPDSNSACVAARESPDVQGLTHVGGEGRLPSAVRRRPIAGPSGSAYTPRPAAAIPSSPVGVPRRVLP